MIRLNHKTEATITKSVENETERRFENLNSRYGELVAQVLWSFGLDRLSLQGFNSKAKNVKYNADNGT